MPNNQLQMVALPEIIERKRLKQESETLSSFRDSKSHSKFDGKINIMEAMEQKRDCNAIPPLSIIAPYTDTSTSDPIRKISFRCCATLISFCTSLKNENTPLLLYGFDFADFLLRFALAFL